MFMLMRLVPYVVGLICLLCKTIAKKMLGKEASLPACLASSYNFVPTAKWQVFCRFLSYQETAALTRCNGLSPAGN